MYGDVERRNFHIIVKELWHWNEEDELRKLVLGKWRVKRGKRMVNTRRRTVNSSISGPRGFSERRRGVTSICIFRTCLFCCFFLQFLLLETCLRYREEKGALEPVLLAMLA